MHVDSCMIHPCIILEKKQTKKNHNKTLDWEHIFTINYDFCLNELLISCSLIISKVVFKFRCGVGLRDVEYECLHIHITPGKSWSNFHFLGELSL